MIELPSPLHPAVVHFPIALFMTAFVLEIIGLILKKDSLHKSALHLYIFAALITPLIVKTGLWEAERLKLSHPLLDLHQQYATWLMWSALMSLPFLYFFKKEFPAVFRVFFIVCLINTAVLVTLTGDKGGRMVYEYGVGVEE